MTIVDMGKNVDHEPILEEPETGDFQEGQLVKINNGERLSFGRILKIDWSVIPPTAIIELRV